MPSNLNITESVYREKLLEHLLMGELLKYSWLRDKAALEVLTPSIDRHGHDIVLVANGVTRHVQLKSSAAESIPTLNIHTELFDKQKSGCVIVIRFYQNEDDMGLTKEFWFSGGAPGQPLRSTFIDLKSPKRPTANAKGEKPERLNHRVFPKDDFKLLGTVAKLYEALFGPLKGGEN